MAWIDNRTPEEKAQKSTPALNFTLEGNKLTNKYLVYFDERPEKIISESEYLRIEKIILAADFSNQIITPRGRGAYLITWEQIEGVNGGTLPPVEVVAKAPTKNGTNKKMLVVGIVVVMCVFLALATKPIKRKR